MFLLDTRLILVALTLVAGLGVSPRVPQEPPFVCGNWRVAGIVGYSAISGRDDPRLIGVDVSYLPKAMTFGKALTVSQPKYRISRWSSAKFEIETRETLNDLGIAAKWITVVEVAKNDGTAVDGPGKFAFFKNDSELITWWDGVFYGLKRIGKECDDTK